MGARFASSTYKGFVAKRYLVMLLPRNRRSLLVAALAVLLSSPAHALMVAGWDFSQYAGDGALTINGVDFVNTLPANYSNLDPTFNAGRESAAFGTLYFNGSFGSSNIDPVSGTEFLPVAGSLTANLEGPVQGPGDNPFDSFAILAFEGQTFTQLISMSAFSPVAIVFAVDLTSVLGIGTDWQLTFGGRTLSGTSPVGIDFSTDGSAYTTVGTINLTTADAVRGPVSLSAVETERAFVRLRFNPSGQAIPVIDNLGISAAVTIIPEPGTWALLAAGIGGLALGGRRRAG
jgi:opacity protein-like surface antigen